MLNNADDTANLMPFDDLIPSRRMGFIRGPHTNRHDHTLDEQADSALLSMPSWDDQYLGVKLFGVLLKNTFLGRQALSPAYMPANATTGKRSR